MKCPRCGRPGKKAFGGYCTKVHNNLNAPPKFIRLECASCGDPVIRVPSQVSPKVYCKRCSKNSGETHPRWREGQYINPAGYRMILQRNTYVLEHRVTWERANLACLLPHMHGIVIIHHINMTKSDNRPENLVMLSNKVHGRLHRLIDAGRYDEAKCELIKNLEQQAFFLLHSQYLEHIRKSSLKDILD